MPQVDKMLETEGDFQCHMKDCAAIGEGRKLLINGQLCAMEDIVVEDADQCVRGAPYNDAEGAVCANDGTATEAYCSYDVGPKACARCTNPIAALSYGGDSLARVRWSTMQLLALMGVASIAFSALN